MPSAPATQCSGFHFLESPDLPVTHHSLPACFTRALRFSALALCLAGSQVGAMAQESGTPLRVAVFPHGTHGLSTAQAARLVEDFAHDLGRPAHWAVVTAPERLFGQLATHDADLVIGNLPVPLAADTRVAATDAVATERYVMVGKREATVSQPLLLRNRQIGLPGRAPLWNYFRELGRVVPGFKLQRLPYEAERGAAFGAVERGELDAVVVDLVGARAALADHPGLTIWFDVTGDEPVNWFVRREDEALRSRFNAFLERFHAAYEEPAQVPAPRNFEAIRKSGVLRVITRMERPNYYVDSGRQAGFEFDAARSFAESQGLRLEVLVAQDERQMLDWLRSGTGDLITGRLAGEILTRNPDLSPSIEYHHTAYVAVGRAGQTLVSPVDLEGRQITAPLDSPEWRALQSGRPHYAGWTVQASGTEESRDTLLQEVASGQLDATVVPGEEVARITARYPTLKAGPSIPHRYAYRWVSRGGDPELQGAVDGFLRDAYRTGLIPFLVARHFDDGQPPAQVAHHDEHLSPFDTLVQRYADRYGFDWRLIAAQMYQESQFNPQATSPSGAVGLLQLLPSTAGALGFDNLTRPESSIHAGVKYLYTLRNEFGAAMPVGERTWFALAAYNLGLQGVERARELAARMALDPNRWSGNVERAMQKLARERGSADAPRYGQALVYVRTIRSLYGSYRNLPSLAAIGRGSVPSA